VSAAVQAQVIEMFGLTKETTFVKQAVAGA
jgi:Arc/MetJ family transcription regulator